MPHLVKTGINHKHPVPTQPHSYSLIALLSGLGSALAFPPYGLVGLMFLSTTTYCYTLSRSDSPTWTGFWYGFGKFALGIGWVINSLRQFTDFPIWLSLSLMTMLIAALSLYDTIAAMLYCRFKQTKTTQPLLLAAILLLAEWCRASCFGGFPWLLSGYTLASTPLLSFAAIGGVFGLSAIVYVTSSLLAYAMSTDAAYRHLAALLAILVVITPLSLGRDSWGRPLDILLKIRLVQGNVNDNDKWQYPFMTLQRYLQLSDSGDHHDELIIWPESTLTSPNQRAALAHQISRQWLRGQHATMIIGEIGMLPSGQLTNRMTVFGWNSGHYDKQHLVPFGEYNPFEAITHRMPFFEVPFADLVAGKQSQPLLRLNHTLVSPFICFEIAFNDRAFRQKTEDASWLLTTTDDNWFGVPWAQAQHLQIAQVRSAEVNKPQVIVGNNGPTAFINARGQLNTTIPPGVSSTLSSTLHPYQSKTPFSRIGNAPWLIVSLSTIGLCLLTKLFNRYTIIGSRQRRFLGQVF